MNNKTVFWDDFESGFNWTTQISENVVEDSQIGIESTNEGNQYLKAIVTDRSSDWFAQAISPIFESVEPAQDFRVSYDFNPINPDWGQYPGIGLVSEGGDNIFTHRIVWSDHTYKKFEFRLYDEEGNLTNETKSSTIPQEDAWYKTSINYGADEESLNIEVIEPDGEVFFEETISDFILPGSFSKIRVGEQGGGPAYGDYAQIGVDNIHVQAEDFEVDGPPNSLDHVFLQSGQLNSTEVGPDQTSITLAPGESIVGALDITVENGHGSENVLPVVVTPTWGEHSEVYWTVDSWAPTGESSHEVNIDLTAPDEAGTYYLFILSQAEMTAANVVSATHHSSSATDIWNNGDDVASWGEDEFYQAINQGWVEAPQYEDRMAQWGVTAVRVEIKDDIELEPTNPTQSEIFTLHDSSKQTPMDLVNAIAGNISGISIIDDSVNYIGADSATSTFENFNFGGPVRMNNSGILITSGDGAPPLSNTEDTYTLYHGNPGDPRFDEVAQAAFDGAGQTNDAAILEFSFTVDDPGVQSISFDLIFGSEEFPEFIDSSFVDIAAVLVNDVNYGLFDGDAELPLSVIGANIDDGNLLDNGTGYPNTTWPYGSVYDIEYNGISPRLTINIPLDGSDVYDVRIGVADTGDHVYDSGLFVSNFSTSAFDYGGLQVRVEANPEGGVVEAAGPNTATYFQGGLGNDIFQGSTAPDIYDLQTGGENVIQGDTAQLNTDTVLGFQPDDKIEVLESFFTEDDLTVTMGSAILDIDSNGDGEKDTQITLEGDFENAVFNVDQSDLGSVVTYDISQEAPKVEASDYAHTFIKALAGDGVEVNAALMETFSKVLGRMLIEGDDGHWEPTSVFDTLAPVFTFVVTNATDRPVNPFAYTNEAKEEAHAAARGEGSVVESVMLEWDDTGVIKYEADADKLRADGGDAVTFQLASEVYDEPNLVQVSISHFSADDVLDLTAIDVEGTPVIEDASDEDGQLSIKLSTQDGVLDVLPAWNIELVDVDPDLVAALGDDLVAGLDNADWFLI